MGCTIYATTPINATGIDCSNNTRDRATKTIKGIGLKWLLSFLDNF